jgi:hypothetical protein
MFFHETINPERYVRLIFSPFFEQLTDDKKPYRHFFQDNAMTHAASILWMQ